MSINKNELTKEQIAKAMSCETAEELMELAKTIGVELTKEEAEAYMVEMEDVELDSDALKQVAGGGGYADLCWSNTKPIFTNSYLKIFQRVDGGQT